MSAASVLEYTKVCRICNNVYPTQNFHLHKGMHDGRKNECNECCRKYNRKREVQRGHLPYNKSKKSSWYLGVFIAERLLANVFGNVIAAPTNQRGYDFICGRGYKVDVKSSCIHSREQHPYWNFTIKRNNIPDYFACIALDARTSLIPQHLWIIPREKICHLQGLNISLTQIEKWAQYEKSIDKVILACNILKEEVAE